MKRFSIAFCATALLISTGCGGGASSSGPAPGSPTPTKPDLNKVPKGTDKGGVGPLGGTPGQVPSKQGE